MADVRPLGAGEMGLEVCPMVWPIGDGDDFKVSGPAWHSALLEPLASCAYSLPYSSRLNGVLLGLIAAKTRWPEICVSPAAAAACCM